MTKTPGFNFYFFFAVLLLFRKLKHMQFMNLTIVDLTKGAETSWDAVTN